MNRQLTLENVAFVNRVGEEVSVLKTQLLELDTLRNKIVKHGEGLTLKLEGVLKEDKKTSKLGESPFSVTSDVQKREEEAQMSAILTQMVGQPVIAKRIDTDDVDSVSSNITQLQEFISESIIYKVIEILYQEKVERLKNCKNKLKEFGIEVE